MTLLRLDKIIADCGVASRSEAAKLIRQGRVAVDGIVAISGAAKHDPKTVVITVDGTALRYKRYYYMIMNKPAGYVTSASDKDGEPVTALLKGRDARLGLMPAGRLDRDAEGLLLLTNDGDFAHRVISPSHKIMKRYFVETDGIINSGDIEAFAAGIELRDGTKCRPAKLETVQENEHAAFVTLGEGKYHQVKRMIAACGKRVLRLKRVAIGGLGLPDDLMPGEYRELADEELYKIQNMSKSVKITSTIDGDVTNK